MNNETNEGTPGEEINHAESSERNILDIPSTVMLQDSNVSYWVDRYRQYARRSPSEICLPAIVRSGPAFESVVQPPQASLGGSDPLSQWVADARNELGPDGVVWGRVLLHFGFTAAEYLFIRDQYDTPGDQICIANRISQKVVAQMVTEVLDRGVDGIVLDAVNILPSAGSNYLDDNEISVSCFCDHCVSGLRERGFRVKWNDFMGPRNRMRIVLHNTATGTDHIDPTHETLQTRDHDRLLSLARARQFLSAEEDWRDEAIALIKYLEARGRLVWESFRALTEPCKGRARTAVVLGSVDYDQSQHVTAEIMMNSGAVDEIWVPDARVGMTAESSSLVCYLASRSSYYANSLFATLEHANEIIVAFGLLRRDGSAVQGKRRHSPLRTGTPKARRGRHPEGHRIRPARTTTGTVPHRGGTRVTCLARDMSSRRSPLGMIPRGLRSKCTRQDSNLQPSDP
ncbi:hypothetical protein GCM10018780_38350 [Streptomyces lanatus]|nr:hypothetical protein GCM10018780_38350 [Streptomyces lanatus]